MPSLLRRLLAVFCGGLCGTLLRVLFSLLLQSWLGHGWPYDIFIINVGGAFLLACGIVLVDAALLGPTRHLFFNVGLLGAYTTFSSLALGDALLFSEGNWLSALLYPGGSLLAGLLAIVLGRQAGLWIIKHAWKHRKEVVWHVEHNEKLLSQPVPDRSGSK